MAVERESLLKEISDLEDTIKYLTEKKEKLQELYDELFIFEECTSIESRTLRRSINKDTKTVKLMDEFESVTAKGFKKYVRLIERGYYSYNREIGFRMVIERLEDVFYDGDVTITNYKTGMPYDLRERCNEAIEEFLDYSILEEGDSEVVLFDIPYRLRAQNSGNRTGYGSEYNGYDLVHQGTLYGETTEYAFVGVEVFVK